MPYDAQVEYLESRGGVIETGFKPNQDTGLRISISVISESTTSRFFEARTSSWDAEFGLLNFLSSGSGLQVRYGNHVGGVKVAPPMTVGVVYDIFMDRNKVYNGDVLLYEFEQYTFQSRTYISLFSLNSASDANNKCRIHSCKIYDNDQLAMDLIPVRVGTVGYMYDNISGKLIGNTGTGTITAGPDIQQP